MLATWIRDFYRLDERKEVRDAINYLCSPMNNLGYASNGIYQFFAPATYETMYVGLASDLSHRFAQHNGLVATAPEKCKWQQISSYFESHEYLGIAILVQSAISQMSVARQAGTPMAEYYDEDSNITMGYSDEGHEVIVAVEGNLIASFAKETGQFPQWNKIGGSKSGAASAHKVSHDMLSIAAGASDSYLVARPSIRGLWHEEEGHELVEETLHVARMNALARAGHWDVSNEAIMDELVEIAESRLYKGTFVAEHLAYIREVDYLATPSPQIAINTPMNADPSSSTGHASSASSS